MKTGKGKAMLMMTINGLKNTNRSFDLQRTIMPTAKDAAGLIDECLLMTGSSRYLARGASARIVG